MSPNQRDPKKTNAVPPPGPEELLRHAGWMRAMALSLVGNSAGADDVVQGAFTAALDSPPSNRQALGGWLKSVVRNLSRQTHRQSSRRKAREKRVARPEAENSSPEDLVARAELQRVIVDAVLALEEPYRSTVMLRFFEERTPHEIAASQGIPVKTVWTRLSRAIEQLRVALDKKHGSRDAWCSLLLPLIAMPTLVTGAAAATTAATPTATTASTTATATTVGTAATTPALLTATGGTLIMNKIIIGVGLIGVAIAGIAVGRYATTATAEAPKEQVQQVASPELAALEEERLQLADQVTALTEERDAERARMQELQAQLVALQEQVAQGEAAVLAEAAANKPKPIPVSFGKYAELEGVKNADWDRMAEAVEVMTDLFLDMIAREAEGLDPPEGFAQTIGRENSQLVKYIGGVGGELPTQSAVNGEYTHPLTLTNLLGAMLERAEVGFTDAQLERVTAYGEAYEAEYDRLQESYDERTHQQLRVLDEVRLKQRTMAQVEDEMTDAQRDVAIAPELHGAQQADVTSPVLMLMMTVNPYVQDSPEQIRTALPVLIGQGYDIQPETLTGMEPAYDRYMQDVASILTPIPADEAQHYRLNEAVIAGEAYATLLDALLAHPAVDSAKQEQIRQNPGWFVPRVRLPAEE